MKQKEKCDCSKVFLHRFFIVGKYLNQLKSVYQFRILS
jgi:hypothetical protein